MVGVGAAPLWLERALYAGEAPGARKKILVAIFQRGAADGLNVVVPHGEQAYYDLRPTIAIPRPTNDPAKKDGAAIDLDGFFGLHPSLAPPSRCSISSTWRSWTPSARPTRRDRISTRRTTWNRARRA